MAEEGVKVDGVVGLAGEFGDEARLAELVNEDIVRGSVDTGGEVSQVCIDVGSHSTIRCVQCSGR
jgi:hypothetical protein